MGFEIYEAIIQAIPRGIELDCTATGKYWAMAQVQGRLGLAMHTQGQSIEPMFPQGLQGLELRQAAQAIKSWNFQEASMALAAVNAYFNSPERLAELGCFADSDSYCADGLDLKGKNVALIGHLYFPPELKEQLNQLYIIEREPKPGDYPDPACEYILPRCQCVIISGSAIINKTLPRLLSLSAQADIIITGPSVPMLPQLLDFGIRRLSGLVVDQTQQAKDHVLGSVPGSPYHLGRSFTLG